MLVELDPNSDVKIMLKINVGTKSEPAYDDYQPTEIEDVHDCFRDFISLEAVDPYENTGN